MMNKLSNNFEEIEYEELLDYKAPYNYVKSRLHKTKTTYVFLDEIQQVENFQKAVDSLYVKKNVRSVKRKIQTNVKLRIYRCLRIFLNFWQVLLEILFLLKALLAI